MTVIPSPARPSLWACHFTRNRHNRPEPDWSAPTPLTQGQIDRLLPSLCQMALGDGGGPGALIGHDRARAIDSDAQLKHVTDLWMQEEREHSRLLECAVRRFGGTPIADHWSFTLFLALRHRLGVRAELVILLLTEIVSHAWYHQLYLHCPDPAIHAMTRLIMRDESGHIAFHADRLATLERPFPLWWRIGFVMLGLAAAATLWVNHHGAVRSAGGSHGAYARSVWRGLTRFMARVRRQAAVTSIAYRNNPARASSSSWGDAAEAPAPAGPPNRRS